MKRRRIDDEEDEEDFHGFERPSTNARIIAGLLETTSSLCEAEEYHLREELAKVLWENQYLRLKQEQLERLRDMSFSESSGVFSLSSPYSPRSPQAQCLSNTEEDGMLFVDPITMDLPKSFSYEEDVQYDSPRSSASTLKLEVTNGVYYNRLDKGKSPTYSDAFSSYKSIICRFSLRPFNCFKN